MRQQPFARGVGVEPRGRLRACGRALPDEELEGAEILAIEEKLEDLQAPVQRFVYLLHPFVAFLIMPIFAIFVESGAV